MDTSQTIIPMTEDNMNGSYQFSSHSCSIQLEDPLQFPNSKDQNQKIEAILKKTLLCSFDPFEFSCSPFIKISSPQFSKVVPLKNGQIITIQGATFGRGEASTFCFADLTKISSAHAKIFYTDHGFCLQDLGSKGGTFVKINSLSVSAGMIIYIGNKFAFKIIDLQHMDGYGKIVVSYERLKKFVEFPIIMRKNEVWKVGNDPLDNQSSFQRSNCYSQLSPKHFELSYEYNWKQDKIEFVLKDVGSEHGTWLRLSAKSEVSQPLELSQNLVFNLSFQTEFKVVELQ